MPYTAEISRASPACFLFLVIQCMGMKDPMEIGGCEYQRKGEVAADAVNRIVDTLSQRCSSGMDVRDYFHVGILGFTSEGAISNAEKLMNTYTLPGTTPERPFLPISQVVEVAEIQERKVKENYGGEIVEVIRRMPVWLRHYNRGNWDPMRAMLQFVTPSLANWIDSHPDSYPPIVVIICDGWASDGDPLEDALTMKNLRTKDGNVLLFIVHLSNNDDSRPTLFPSQEDGLQSLGEGQDDSKLMFRMTSVLPECSRRAAADLGFAVDEESRGFVLNADAVSLAQFLDIGTRGPSNLH